MMPYTPLGSILVFKNKALCSQQALQAFLTAFRIFRPDSALLCQPLLVTTG